MKKKLIVGLGNIGEKYLNTRHNIGFDIIDNFISNFSKEKEGIFTNCKHYSRAEIRYKGCCFVLIKPNTYMNLSGKAVVYALQKEKLSPSEDLLVLTDDLSLPFGKIRLRPKGSDGGHNGLKSIQESILNNYYSRLRFGIGNDFIKGCQVDYVISQWSFEEKKVLKERLNISSEAIFCFAFSGISQAMNLFNGK